MTDTLEEIARELISRELCCQAVCSGMRQGCPCAQSIAAALRKAVQDEREACAKACEAEERIYLSPEYATGQPLSSVSERGACRSCARAIRARKVSP